MTTYLVAGTRPWNRAIFDTSISSFPGSWYYVETLDALREHLSLNPQYIFFLHWSDYVPSDIYDAYECVVFHPSHLPCGRGGSPLQNLIAQGYTHTHVTAFRMVKEVDAGPIYLTRTLSLDGRAQDIFEREMLLAAGMIWRIISDEMEPQPQRGEIVKFKRRSPQQSEISAWANMEELYDHIRMLDAETYPHAYIDKNTYRIEFSDAKLTETGLIAKATFVEKKYGD